ncbi:MAG: alpha/beta hydrolase [Defluviicoccus sp.]
MVDFAALVLLSRRAALVLVLLLAATTTACTDLFFHPTRTVRGSPADLGLSYRDVWFDAADGTRLHGWFLPARGTAKALIVHLHGNAGNVAGHLGFVAWLPAEGISVLTFDYRGYGRSGGTPTLAGVHLDAAAALDHVLALQAGEGMSTQPVGVLGQSLGGSVAITALARAGLKSRFCLLVTDGAFAGYRQIVRDKLAGFWLTWPLKGPLSAGIDADYDPVDAIAALAPLPLLILHGAEDPVVPAAHGKALYAAAGQPKQLWLVRGGGHLDALATPELRRLLVETLHTCGAPFDASAATD